MTLNKVNHLAFYLVFLLATSAFAEQFGTFMVVKGSITLISPKNVKSSAKVGSRIFVGWSVVAGPDSRAKILMSDRNIISINPNTQIQFSNYTNNESEKKVRIDLGYGKIRADVEQKYTDTENSKFEIRTATAVAGVRGTQYIVQYDKTSQNTKVITVKGVVYLAGINKINDDASIGEKVVISKGYKAEAQSGQRIEEPIKLSTDEFLQEDKQSKSDKRQGSESKESAGESKSSATGTSDNNKSEDEKDSNENESEDRNKSENNTENSKENSKENRNESSSDSKNSSDKNQNSRMENSSKSPFTGVQVVAPPLYNPTIEKSRIKVVPQ
jgi:hypothetical protein